MAKSVYLGNGNSHKVTKMYEGNGTAQKIKKGYIGDSSGKARLFFSGATRWNRYTVITQYRWNVYNIGYTEAASTGSAGWSTPLLQATSNTFAAALSKPALNTVTGKYSVSGGIKGNLKLTGTTFAISSTASSIIVFSQQVELTISLSNSGSRAILYSYFMDPVPYTTYRAVQGKGSFVSTVQSANQSQYPTNGISGNLWYEYTGSVNTIGPLIDTVESDNENAYPANGISGNYWYVKIT